MIIAETSIILTHILYILDATSRAKTTTKAHFFEKQTKKQRFIGILRKKTLPLHPQFFEEPHTPPHAPVAKLVDALDLGSSNASCVGSSPIRRTTQKDITLNFSVISCFILKV